MFNTFVLEQILTQCWFSLLPIFFKQLILHKPFCFSGNLPTHSAISAVGQLSDAKYSIFQMGPFATALKIKTLVVQELIWLIKSPLANMKCSLSALDSATAY